MRKKIDLGNVITAMVSPFTSKGLLDLVRAGSLAEHLVKNGTDTLLLVGSTGEASQLSEDEKWALVDHVRHSIPEGTKIMVSAGDKNIQRAIENVRRAFEIGADAVLVPVPEYIKPPQDVLARYFGTIAQAMPDKPFFIYNIPGRTGTEIFPETVAKIAQKNPNIIGIKQSFGNMDRVSELKSLCPPDFQIYSGDDSLTLPMLALGAKGVISVASHLEGNLIQQMIRDFKKGHVAQAEQTHRLLYPLYKALFMTTNPLPIKEALYQKGLIASPLLRTMGEMTPEQKLDLKGKLHCFAGAKAFALKKQSSKTK